MLVNSLQSVPISISSRQFLIQSISPFLNIIVRRPDFQLTGISLVYSIQLKTAIRTQIIISYSLVFSSYSRHLYSSASRLSHPRDFPLQDLLIAIRTSFSIIPYSIFRLSFSQIISPRILSISQISILNVVFLLYKLVQQAYATSSIPLFISSLSLSKFQRA